MSTSRSALRSERSIDERVYSALPYESSWRFGDVLGGVNSAPAWSRRHLTEAEVRASLQRLIAAGRAVSRNGWWRIP